MTSAAHAPGTTATAAAGAADDTVAIVGAGWLGQALARALLQPPAGAATRVIATTRSGASELPATVAAELGAQAAARLRVVALDLPHDGAVVADRLAGATALVIAIAPGVGRGADPDGRRGHYLAAIEALLAGAAALPLTRVVHVGSTSAIADELEGPVDELRAAPLLPREPRGLVQREAEAQVFAAAAARGWPTLVLRMGGLIGPGRELERLYLRPAPEPRPGDGWTATNLIHQADAVAALLAALRAPADREGVVHVVDGDPQPRRAMVAVAARRAGVPEPRWERPAPVGDSPRGKQVVSTRLGPWLGVHEFRPRFPSVADEPA